MCRQFRNGIVMSRRQEGGGNHPAGALSALRGQRELRHPLPSRVHTIGEPLEPIKLPDAPLNVRIMLRNLFLMLLLSAAFLGAALFADFVSSFVQLH